MKFWRNLQIRYKLLTIFFTVIILFISGFILVFNQIILVDSEVKNLNDRSNLTVLVKEVDTLINDKYIAVLNYDRNGQVYEEYNNRLSEQLSNNFQLINQGINNERQQELFNSITQTFESLNENIQKVYATPRPRNDQEHIDRIRYLTQIDSSRNLINIHIGNLIEIVTEQMYEAEERVSTAITTATYILIGSLVTAIIIGTLLILLFSNVLTRQLNEVNNMAKNISNGNLNVEKLKVKSKDEIGSLTSSVNEMSESLKSLVQQISSTAEQVAASSEQLTASSNETGSITEQITQSIQQVAVGADNQLASANSATEIAGVINDSIKGIQENVLSVANSSLETVHTASAGNKVIESTINQMNFISEKTNVTSRQVEMLGNKSIEIGQIVSLISDVSNQTNLLALNAAIEAARAGEHGKGFSVVADEVRKLAEQSGHAAEQINQLIQAIQTDITRSVTLMDESKNAVDEGITLVAEAGGTFANIADSVSAVTEQIEQIKLLVNNVIEGTENMTNSIIETTKIAEQSAGFTQTVAASTEEQLASMQEIMYAANSLTKMSEELQDAVSKFKFN